MAVARGHFRCFVPEEHLLLSHTQKRLRGLLHSHLSRCCFFQADLRLQRALLVLLTTAAPDAGHCLSN